MKYLEMDMPACLGDMGHQAVYLKTRAQLFNRRKSRNTKLKALRCLQVNTYFGRMKHWPATQSSSSTADASIDNDERYAYRNGGVEVVGGESDQTVGVPRPGDLVTRPATTDVEMPAVAGDGRCDVLAVVDFDPVVAPARPPAVRRVAKDDGLAAKAEHFSESLVSILESVKDNVASFGSLARNSEWFLSLKSDAAKDRMMSAGSLKVRGYTFYVRSADKTQFSARVHWAPPFIPNAAIVKVLALYRISHNIVSFRII